ncbi:MAG: hypothetical protein JSS02_06690 [Planctomycetes bacterium]|nr:hypothetical protein [Planctomycetota bacterium]
MDRSPKKHGPQKKKPNQPGKRRPGPVKRANPPPADDNADELEDSGARLPLKRIDKNLFAFQPPFCAIDRKEDMDEVRNMIAGGELDIARDELLYLVSDCRAFLDAHNRLGELALEEEDIPLAQGHFGFAYEIGLDSLPAGFQGILPSNRDYNRAFFLAGRGLARCLIARGQHEKGREVLVQLLKLDPREENAKSLLDELDEQLRERKGAK